MPLLCRYGCLLEESLILSGFSESHTYLIDIPFKRHNVSQFCQNDIEFTLSIFGLVRPNNECRSGGTDPSFPGRDIPRHVCQELAWSTRELHILGRAAQVFMRRQFVLCANDSWHSDGQFAELSLFYQFWGRNGIYVEIILCQPAVFHCICRGATMV